MSSSAGLSSSGAHLTHSHSHSHLHLGAASGLTARIPSSHHLTGAAAATGGAIASSSAGSAAGGVGVSTLKSVPSFSAGSFSSAAAGVGVGASTLRSVASFTAGSAAAGGLIAGGGAGSGTSTGGLTSGGRREKLKFVLRDLLLHTTVGTGTFGRVRVVQHKATKAWYALKILKKSAIIRLKQMDHIKSEVKILSTIDHPFIVNL